MNVEGCEYRTTPWRWIAVAMATGLLPLMIWVSADYGATWDELPRQAYGERIWQYYEGRLRLDRFRDDGSGSHLYGGLFEVVAIALQRALDADPYRVRHAWNACVGWLGVVFCGVLASRIGGPRLATLAMLLLSVTPPYWGHAMNNPKDIPFATAATAALAAIAAIPTVYPLLSWRRILLLGAATGAALAIRPGGLLLLGYAGVALLVQAARARVRTSRQILATAAGFAGVVAIATTVPLPFWPWLQREPYLGLLSAAAEVSNFEWRGTMIFMGADEHSMRLPWYYVPVWLGISMPLVVLGGALLSLAPLWRRWPASVGAWGLLAAVLFPIGYVIATQATLYDGLRHLLFVVPPLVVLAALGWSRVLAQSRRPVAVVAGVVFALGVAEPIVFGLRNHPNQVVYFNPVAGGPRGAVGRYELDYWGNCLLQAQRQVASLARRAGMPVVVSGHRWRQMGANAARLPQIVARRPAAASHHVEIVLHRGPRAWIEALARREDVIARVETADGARLCSVVPGPAFGELAARLPR